MGNNKNGQVRILITGERSFVGTNFIKNSMYKSVVEVSLFNTQPHQIDFSQYDVVLHLVAIVHQSKHISPDKYFEINRDLCLKIAENAKKAGVKQFIFMSTVKVYGIFNQNAGPWNEDSVCKPDDYYGISKYEAEIALRKMHDENFVVSIIRTPLVYGIGVKANMLNILTLVHRLPILPLGKIKNKRNFTSAENLVAYIDRIIDLKASGVFIVMDEKSLSTTDLVNLISMYLEKKLFLFRMPAFLISIGKKFLPNIFDRLYGSFEIDNSKTMRKLNFHPPLSTEEGIKKMVLAYKNTPWENS